MILGDDAVTTVVKRINANKQLLTDFKGRAYKYERPEKLDGEYIAVNHLDFVRRNVVEEGVVNVNIHVPKTASNEPNTKRLSTLVKGVIALFSPSPIYIDGAFLEFYSDSRPTLDNDDTYYINLKFNVTYNNLKE